ncbi:MAG: SEC-C metal-binding domain-containing protein [Pseudomonadota bacterium]
MAKPVEIKAAWIAFAAIIIAAVIAGIFSLFQSPEPNDTAVMTGDQSPAIVSGGNGIGRDNIVIQGDYVDGTKIVYPEQPVNNHAAVTYVFPKLDGNLNEIDKATTFSAQTLDDIKTSFGKPLDPDTICPCGSGKKYGECHSPMFNNSEMNLWRGPGFQKSFYFGYREPLNGIEFQKKKRGEIIALKKGVKVSLCKYFTMEYSILTNKAIVRSLTVSEGNKRIVFSGLLEIEGDPLRTVQILVGTPSTNFVTDFEAKTGGKTVSHERGQWAGFIGEPINPMEGMLKDQWYRYFMAEGFLLEIHPGNQLFFKMSKIIEPVNTFTLSLPFNNIELAYPKIVTESSFSEVTLEVERENIYWDLVLFHGQFAEDSKGQKDSLFVEGVAKTGEIGDRYKGIRQTFFGPRKIRICLSNPK